VGTENGWEIFEAKNNVAALASIVSRQVGVILVEHDVVTGHWAKLISELQHNIAAPRVVVFSRWNDQRLMTDVSSRGGFASIDAPFNKNVLLSVVTDAWKDWREGRNLTARNRKLATMSARASTAGAATVARKPAAAAGLHESDSVVRFSRH